MFTQEVLNQELLDEDTLKIVVLLSGDTEICSVEDKPSDFIERGTEYHHFLHEQGIGHSHNRINSVVTVFIEPPYTEEKLNKALVTSKENLYAEMKYVENFLPESKSIQESATADGEITRTSYTVDKAPKELINTLMENFPDVDLKSIQIICSPVWHSLLEKTIITVMFWKTAWPENIFNDKRVVTCARKYCLEDKKYFDKCYVEENSTHELLPEGSTLKYSTFNTNIQDGLEITDFVDYYFSGDPDVVEEALNLPYLRGKVSTYYGVTVVNNEIIRKKQYCYDEDSNLSEWI